MIKLNFSEIERQLSKQLIYEETQQMITKGQSHQNRRSCLSFGSFYSSLPSALPPHHRISSPWRNQFAYRIQFIRVSFIYPLFLSYQNYIPNSFSLLPLHFACFSWKWGHLVLAYHWITNQRSHRHCQLLASRNLDCLDYCRFIPFRCDPFLRSWSSTCIAYRMCTYSWP